MLRRIEKETDFMKSVDAVAKEYGVEEIYANHFDGVNNAGNMFVVKADRGTEAFREMYMTLLNPLGLSMDDVAEPENMHNINTIYCWDIGTDDTSLIYRNGEWFYADEASH